MAKFEGLCTIGFTINNEELEGIQVFPSIPNTHLCPISYAEQSYLYINGFLMV